MSNAKRVTVVSVQKLDDGCIVRLSAHGGWGEELRLGPAHMRTLAIAFAAAFRDISPADLAKEIAGMCEVEEKPFV